MIPNASGRQPYPVITALRKYPFLITAMISCMMPFETARAQQVILNTRGERIVVYPDGAWRYYEPGDSALLSSNLLKEDLPGAAEGGTDRYDDSEQNPASDADISALAIRFAERMRAEENLARQALARIVETKFTLEARLEQAEANREIIEPDLIASLEDEIEVTRLEVKSARKELQWLERISAKATALVSSPVDRKAATLNKLLARYDSRYAGNSVAYRENREQDMPGVPRYDGTVTMDRVPDSNGPGADPETGTLKSDPGISEVYRRAPVPCVLEQLPGGQNVQPGIAVQKNILFSHTDEDLRPYFRDQELVTCNASLRLVENNLYLVLEFIISSPDARRNFGLLEAKSLLRLKLLNGDFVNLFNTRTDLGKLDAYTGDTIYSGSYFIDKTAEKSLSKVELDKVRVVWSSGFEDYDIVNVDFLINQFSCLSTLQSTSHLH